MFDDFVMNYYYIKDSYDSSSDSIGIRSTTKEGYYYIDETKTNIFATPTLQPTSLNMPSPEIVRTNNIIDKRTQWVISFKITKCPIPNGGFLKLVIPEGVLLPVKYSTIDVLSYDTSGLYPDFNVVLSSNKESATSITINNFCNATNGCPVGGAYSILLDWIKNPY
jgi:hypothetical protein